MNQYQYVYALYPMISLIIIIFLSWEKKTRSKNEINFTTDIFHPRKTENQIV